MQCIPIPIYKWKKVKKGKFNIIVAETSCQKKQGLQGAPRLPKNTLLLFLNMAPGVFFHTFNCRFPIDIISLDYQGRVLDVWTASPEMRSVGPTPKNTTKVVEAPAGWCKLEKIKKGDYLPFYKC